MESFSVFSSQFHIVGRDFALFPSGISCMLTGEGLNFEF